MYRHRNIHVTIGALLILLLLSACGSRQTPTPTPLPAPTATAVVENTPEPSPEATEVVEEPTEAAPAEAVDASAVMTESETLTATASVTDRVSITESVTVTANSSISEGVVITESVAITDGIEITATSALTEETDLDALAGCPEPTEGTQLISSAKAGYCFLIPADFERSESSDADGFNLGIYGPATTEGPRERAFVDVTEATTDTLEAGVQVVISDVLAALPEFTPTQQSLILGDVEAIQLDGLPGQDITRKLFAVYKDRLYTLTFVPADEESNRAANEEMEQLYALMVDNFHFMTATNAASSFAPFLSWEGEIDGACHTLTIHNDGEAAVGLCGDEPSVTATLSSESGEWLSIQQHFGPIDAETDAGKIVFQGEGAAQNARWAQTLATWASFTAMEINAGRVGAAARTTLAWQLTTTPEHSGFCSQVIVLAYGYAYANQIPCDGNGQATTVAQGWLSDIELDTFARWVSNGERVESEMGYLDATGETPIMPAELTAWANALYTRLLQ